MFSMCASCDELSEWANSNVCSILYFEFLVHWALTAYLKFAPHFPSFRRLWQIVWTHCQSSWSTSSLIKQTYVLSLHAEKCLNMFTCWVHILMFNHSQVCRRFRNCADSPNLQYKMELALAGMQDGPPSDTSPAERLRLLRAHQKAWDSLSWTGEETIPMLKGDTWELVGGVLGLADGSKSILLRQLHSTLRSIPGRTWKVEFDFILGDFTLDPTQDLIAALEVSEYVICVLGHL